MAYLARARKADLITLTDELGLSPLANPKVSQLTKIITESDDYDEDFTKNLLNAIERERLEKIETTEREKLEKIEEEKTEREFELKKLELETATKRSDDSLESSRTTKNNDLLKLMTRYDASGDISIYLALFERQVSRVKIPKEDWITYLLGLLPLEIVNLIAREPDPLANDYDHIRKLLLKRFKLSAEQFRQNFVSHKKNASASWRDFAFELNNFFEEWIDGLEVSNFEDLKELMVVDQLKRKIPSNIHEHFIDDLPKIKKINELVNKLDEYETARYHLKTETSRNAKNLDERNKKRFTKDFDNAQPRQNNIKPSIKCYNCNEMGHKSIDCKNKKEGIRCFKCKCFGHKANSCTQKEVNRTVITSPRNNPQKIRKQVEILNRKTHALFDTGSDVTMISWEFYVEIGSPSLYVDNVALIGISGEEISPLGYFSSEISIDECIVFTKIYVLKKLCNEVVIGIDIINKLNLSLTENGIEILGKRDNFQVNYVRAMQKAQNSQMAEKNEGECKRKVNIKIRDSQATNESSASAPSCKRGDELNTPRKCTPTQGNDPFSFSETCNESETKCFALTDSFLVQLANVVNTDDINLENISNAKQKEEVMKLISGYKPNKTKDEYLNSMVNDREEMREDAKNNILKLQQENCRQFNRKRKKAHLYKINDLVAIQRTQFGAGLKLRPKFFGPYRVKAVKTNDRYDVEKVGSHEGPNATSSAADHMKPWSTDLH